MHTVRMDARLITMAALGAALVLALGAAGCLVVWFRNARRDIRKTQRDRDGARAQVRVERQRADEAEQSAAEWKQHATVATGRLEAYQEHFDEIVQGTRHKAPRKLWPVKGFGWLTGTVTGAWAASRTFASSVTSNAAASSAAVSTGGAVAGGIGQSFALASAAVLVAGAGMVAVYTQPATSAPQSQPPAARGLPNPPAAKRPLAVAPPSVHDTLSTTETPTVTPTVTSTPTPTQTTTSARSATPTTRAEPTTAPTNTPSTTVAASPDPASPVTVTSAAPAGAAPHPASDVAPQPAVDHTTKVHPVPDTEETRSAGKAAKSAQPVQVNRTCLTLEPLLPVTVCAG